MPVTRRKAATIRMSIPLITVRMLIRARPSPYGPCIRCRISRSASGQKWSIMTSANTR